MAKKDQAPEFNYKVVAGAPKKILMPGIGEFELDKLTPQQAKKLISKGCQFVVETTSTEVAKAE